VSEARRIGRLKAVALLLVGCIVGLVVARYWTHWRGLLALMTPAAQQTTNLRHFGFQADFTLPAHIVANDPDKTQLLSFEFGRPKNSLEDIPPITIKNLTEQAFSLSCEILGYDSKKRRVGQASDSIVIGARETALREPILVPDVWATPKYTSFRLICEIRR
jgi:hypothetical protein